MTFLHTVYASEASLANRMDLEFYEFLRIDK